MAVYVDDMAAPNRRMIMCHMVADTKEELLDMVDEIGVDRKWIQEEDTYREHFDICLTKKRIAIRHGAKLITRRELVDIIQNKKYNNVPQTNLCNSSKNTPDSA